MYIIIMDLSLTNDEINKLDDYWDFINIFNNIANKSPNVFEFRINIIKKIKKKYKPIEFYFFEKILNKMLWRLLYKYKIDISKIDANTKLVFGIKNSSCINKQIIFNNDKYVIFPSYKSLSKTLKKILYILSNKDIYNKIIDNTIDIDNITEITEYFYPLDYPFPNINLIYYNNNNKNIWLKKIKAYYYYKDDSKWYKLLY
jgi:hypothetical protein